MPVLAVGDGDDEAELYEGYFRRIDDMTWRYRLWTFGFTWQTWTDWYASRRWIVPDGAIQHEVDHLR